MPTTVHESIQHCFAKAIDQAEIDLPYPAQCFCVQGQAMNQFDGQYLGSVKIADLAVQIRNARGQMETKLVVEIGFSEEYDDLINDVRLWLEGMNSVSMCMLVSFNEEPRYQCPVNDNMKKKRFKKLGFPDPGELRPEDFYLEGPFGPAIYKGRANGELDNEDEEPDDEEPGDEEPEDEEPDDEEPDDKELVWVGHISTAFLERWIRDAQTGKAKKYGKRRVSYILLMRISLLIGML
jgi:hypothetical protein